MATFGWRGDRPLVELLFHRPQHFEFLQAVRLLERTAPGTVPVGTGSRGRREAVRFASSLSAVFPASDIDDLTRGSSASDPAPMRVNFLGLAGAFGPLPTPITELARTRARRGDTATRDFLDIFNHRLVALMARIGRAHRPALQAETPENSAFALYLFALLGLGTDGLRTTRSRPVRNRLAGLDRSLLHVAGLLNPRPVSLHALERLLASHFAVPVRGIPLQGRWLSLSRDQWTVVGSNGSGRNAGLGRGAVLGKRVWSQEAGIRLELGPMSLARFLSFLPAPAPATAGPPQPLGNAVAAFRELIRFAIGDRFDYDVSLILKRREVPAARLSSRGDTRLGWTSWLGAGPRRDDGRVTVRYET
ncbi:MAG: type VI secretion system baseplate subunit TssG [Rhodospirillales bacterium]|nr:MAG: type VI secretion system baseplate subunit TssG [Rhodospirillales bacterium]